MLTDIVTHEDGRQQDVGLEAQAGSGEEATATTGCESRTETPTDRRQDALRSASARIREDALEEAQVYLDEVVTPHGGE